MSWCPILAQRQFLNCPSFTQDYLTEDKWTPRVALTLPCGVFTSVTGATPKLSKQPKGQSSSSKLSKWSKLEASCAEKHASGGGQPAAVRAVRVRGGTGPETATLRRADAPGQAVRRVRPGAEAHRLPALRPLSVQAVLRAVRAGRRGRVSAGRGHLSGGGRRLEGVPRRQPHQEAGKMLERSKRLQRRRECRRNLPALPPRLRSPHRSLPQMLGHRPLEGRVRSPEDSVQRPRSQQPAREPPGGRRQGGLDVVDILRSTARRPRHRDAGMARATFRRERRAERPDELALPQRQQLERNDKAGAGVGRESDFQRPGTQRRRRIRCQIGGDGKMRQDTGQCQRRAVAPRKVRQEPPVDCQGVRVSEAGCVEGRNGRAAQQPRLPPWLLGHSGSTPQEKGGRRGAAPDAADTQGRGGRVPRVAVQVRDPAECSSPRDARSGLPAALQAGVSARGVLLEADGVQQPASVLWQQVLRLEGAGTEQLYQERRAGSEV